MAPTITAPTPANGATGVSVSTGLLFTLNFSGGKGWGLNPGSLQVYVKIGDGTETQVVQNTVAIAPWQFNPLGYNGGQYWHNVTQYGYIYAWIDINHPTAPFPYSTLITWRVEIWGVRGDYGTATFTFTTAAPPELQGPTLSSQSPAPGGIDAGTNPEIGFSVDDLPSPGGGGVSKASLIVTIQGETAYENQAFTGNYAAGSSIAERDTTAGKAYDFVIQRAAAYPSLIIPIRVQASDIYGNASDTTYTIYASDAEDDAYYRGGQREKEMIVAYNPKEGRLPENNRVAWETTGSATHTLTTDNAALRVQDDAINQKIIFSQALSDKILPDSDFEFAADLTINQASDDPSTIQFQLADGGKYFHIAVGTKLTICDQAGTAYYSSDEIIPQGVRFNLRARKQQSRVLELFLDDRLVKAFPCYLAADNSDQEKYFKWGSVSNAGQNDFLLHYLHYGINAPLASNRELERLLNILPEWIARNELLKGLARAFIHGLRFFRNEVEGLRQVRRANNVLVSTIGFDGDTLPENLPAGSLPENPWNRGGDADVAGQLETAVHFSALEIKDQSASKQRYYWADLDGIDQYYDIDVSFFLTILDWDTDGDGYLGLWLDLYDGEQRISLGFQEDAGEFRIGFMSAGDFIGDTIHFDPLQEHRIRILKSHDSRVLGSIDGIIFASLAYSAFADNAPEPEYPSIYFGTTQDRQSESRWRLFRLTTSIDGIETDGDFQPYPLRQSLLQLLADSNLRPSKLESNTELEWWLQHRTGLHQSRGSQRGILIEARHIFATDKVYITTDATFAGWALEDNDKLEWFALDAEGYNYASHLEIDFTVNPNYTPATIASWVRKNLIPMSIRANLWDVCHISTLTDEASAGSNVAILVESNRYFAEGDTVTIRSADNTTQETTTVAAVAGSTEMLLDSLINTYSAGAIIRKYYAGYNQDNI